MRWETSDKPVLSPVSQTLKRTAIANHLAMNTYRIILSIAAVFAFTLCPAYEFEVDGLTYNRVGSDSEPMPCVEVCGHTADLSDTELVIPDIIRVNGQAYKVVGIKGEQTGAFAYSLITSVTIPNSIEYIGDYSFYNNSTLTRAVIGDNVKSVGEGAFMDCRLKEIILPNSVTEMGVQVFYGNSALEKVTLSQNIKILDTYAFFGCSSLKEIELPGGLESIGEFAFEACNRLERIEIPASVRAIGASAFSGDVSLKHVIFNEGLDNIAQYAFNQCPASDVRLPSTLRSIGDHNFTKVIAGTLKGTVPPDVSVDNRLQTENVFYSAKVIIVPESARDAYLAHDYWGRFNIVAEGHEAEITLDGTTSLEELITSKYGYTLSETTSLTLSGPMRDEDFEAIRQNAKSLIRLDMRMADCPSIPAKALEAPYVNGIRATNQFIFIALPDNVTSIGDSAFAGVTANSLVMLTDMFTRNNNFGLQTGWDLYLEMSSMIPYFSVNARVQYDNIYCFDADPDFSIRELCSTLYVPFGTKEKYIRLIWPDYSPAGDGESGDETGNGTSEGVSYPVYEMYDYSFDSDQKTVRVRPFSARISIASVTINGVKAECIGDNVYALPARITSRTDTGTDYIIGIEVAIERQNHVFIHNETVTGIDDVTCDETPKAEKEIMRYNLLGQPIAKPQQGLNIVVYSSGRVEKQFIRHR